jgi:hypothetical protein
MIGRFHPHWGTRSSADARRLQLGLLGYWLRAAPTRTRGATVARLRRGNARRASLRVVVVVVAVAVAGAGSGAARVGGEHYARGVGARDGDDGRAEGEHGFGDGVEELWVHDSEEEGAFGRPRGRGLGHGPRTWDETRARRRVRRASTNACGFKLKVRCCVRALRTWSYLNSWLLFALETDGS